MIEAHEVFEAVAIIGIICGFVMACLHVFLIDSFHPVLWVPIGVAWWHTSLAEKAKQKRDTD